MIRARRTPPAPGPPRRVPSRRQQILRAAASLFAERGFHGVSVDDIGARMGTTGPALYRHFRSKDEVLAELLVGVSRQLLDGGLRRVRDQPDPRRALDALIAFHVGFALDDPDVITVHGRDLANLPGGTQRAVRSLQHRYVAVWADVVEEVTGCARERAVAVAHAVFGLINSTPHSARLEREEMADLLRAMARAAVEGAGGAARGAQPARGPRAGAGQ